MRQGTLIGPERMSNSLKITQCVCKSRVGRGGWLWALLLITPPVARLLWKRHREVACLPTRSSIETPVLKVTPGSGFCPSSHNTPPGDADAAGRSAFASSPVLQLRCGFPDNHWRFKARFFIKFDLRAASYLPLYSAV